MEEGEINSTISDDGTVTFEDIPITFSKTEIDGLLITAQTQDALLYEIDKKMARNRDFLNKVRERFWVVLNYHLIFRIALRLLYITNSKTRFVFGDILFYSF